MIELIQYNDANYTQEKYADIDAVLAKFDSSHVNWVNFDFKLNKDFIDQLTAKIHLHPLVAEDLLLKDIVPKMEFYDDHIFAMIKMMSLNDRSEVVFETVCFILTKDAVFTFQDGVQGDVFGDVRNRIVNHFGKIRKSKKDYLYWRLLDAVIVKYQKVMEHFRTEIEMLEENLIEHPTEIQTNKIMLLKRQINYIRKFIIPLRNEFAIVKIEPSNLIEKSTIAYFKDTLDHLNHLQSSFDSYRDMLRDVLELQNANQSQYMNQVMKTLTIISSIFIPLTFLVGVYGMNFEFMPELHYIYAYPILILCMVLMSIGMLYYFRKKKWL